MNPRAEYMAEVFARLGERLERLAGGPEFPALAERACADNPWFTPSEIRFALEALCGRMLRPRALREWLEEHPACPVAPHASRTVAVTAAGNIPAVGFLDLMCVLAAGHRCLLKPSARDAVIMERIAAELAVVEPGLPLGRLSDAARPDALVASGSDDTCRSLRARFGGIPAVLRGSRSSAALLLGGETDEELALLARDVFTYSGLGCRSVGLLLVPAGTDAGALARSLAAAAPGPHPKYASAYRQQRALLAMSGGSFADGGFFVLAPSEEFPKSAGRVNYMEYGSEAEAAAWLEARGRELQCVVSRRPAFPRSAAFGQAQLPGLGDWPDGVDLLDFLCALP